MEKLIKQQLILLSQIKSAIKNFGKDSKTRKTESYFKKRHERAIKLWTDFENGHKNILQNASLEPSGLEKAYFEDEIFANAEETYLLYLSELEEKVNCDDKLTQNKDESYTLPSPCENNTLKLPRITLPKFSGDYTLWTSFRDLFVSLIHNKSSLSKTEKLHYLKASLTGEAERLIQGFAVTEANYDTAWEILISRYENKRMLVNSQLDILCGQSYCTEASESIKKLLDTTIESVQALQNLKIKSLWDAVLVYITTKKLPKETLQLWEQQISSNAELPAFDTLKAFLETRFRTLEAVEASKSKPTKFVAPHKGNFARHQAFLVERKFTCGVCSGDHLPKNCQKFLKLTFPERNETVKRLGLCINCLNRGHISSSCPSRFACNYCGKRHHSLMHIFSQSSNPTVNANAKEFVPSSSNFSNKEHTGRDSSFNNIQSMHVHTHKEVLLATALVTLEGPWGNKQTFRALLDQGSQASFITETAVQSLGLKKKSTHAIITGIGQAGTESSKARVCAELVPLNSSTHVKFDALVLRNIAHHLPSKALVTNDWHFISELTLADPTFNKPGKIDLLLGADVYANIVLEGIKRGPKELPIAQNTVLGWILCGEVSDKQNQEQRVFTATVIVNDISEQLQKFWNLEEVPQAAIVSPQDEACERFFRENYKRLEDGTYSIKLPFKDNEHLNLLGASKAAAIASLYHLERKFLKDANLKEEYGNVINEYVTLRHMHGTNIDEISHLQRKGETQFYSCYYMPHHAVFKDSTTTKLRVVFDASRKTTSGFSLNDVLLTGPAIQNELIRVLLQWRQHKYSFIADIEKMYRQVKVHPEDINYQRIVWRNSPNEEIKSYALTTVTFGVTCAPYLAMRVLKQLAEDEKHKFPLGARAVLSDFYVDDLLSGADTINDAVEKQKELNLLLQSGGFKLRKWIANDSHVLKSIPKEDRALKDNVDLNLDNGIASLGLLWYPNTDTFGYKVSINVNNEVETKRELLSEIARLYDPLGWISPVITSAKILMQAVWLHGVNWDDPLPSAIKHQWKEFKNNISQLKDFRIPRWLNTSREFKKIEIHAFSDASQRAYATVLYVRTTDEEHITIRILTSKSKVAPVKTVSIPRLELCAVVLAARLVKFVKDTFQFEKVETHLWTDSMIVLSWLNSHPSKWATFISNRTSEILDLLGDAARHHVPTYDNPADLASRGLLPHQLKNNELWWHGPQFLQSKNVNWPIQPIIPTIEFEQKRNVNVNLCIKDTYLLEVLERFSSLGRLVRVTVICLQFVQQIKKTIHPRFISNTEALKIWIKFIQGMNFNKEIYDLQQTQHVDKRSKIANLYPFLDKHGILRVGGRLQNSNLSYDERHPIILPKSSHFVQLILQHYHHMTLHGGSQLMITTMRKRYWLLDARNTVRYFVHKCIVCYRQKAQVSSQLMGNLPSYRVTKSRPFTNTGVDYCGPIQLRMSRHRGVKIFKGYIAIFVCLAVKAVHIELVSDMTATAFIAAFRRFVARRGLCQNIYSDCGSNFVGANAIFKEIYRENEKAAQQLAVEGFNWHFIPPSAPHFGGIWESCVKSAKYHLRRILGNATLTFEEMNTMLSQVEACMNSRPLCPLTSDPEDFTALTPGHFLTGDALLAPAQEDLIGINTNRLDKWRLTQQLLQHFWSRWSKEYLHQLQQRTKWTTLQQNITKNNVVLVKDDRLPPNKWPLGRILETHAGTDGLVRVVTVRMKENIVKRPIAKIALLPIKDNEL